MIDGTRVADELRRNILTGALAGGAPLRQEHLARTLGVSRIPVRDALSLLQREGLVVAAPHEGASVAPTSLASAAEIFEMRLALEPLALRASIEELSNADLGSAEDALAQMRVATGEYDLAQANWLFHSSLYRKAKRPLLLATLDAVHQNASRYQIMGASTRLRFDRSEHEHQALLSACRARDLRGAVDILEHHLRAASEVLLAHLRSISDPSGSLSWPS